MANKIIGAFFADIKESKLLQARVADFKNTLNNQDMLTLGQWLFSELIAKDVIKQVEEDLSRGIKLLDSTKPFGTDNTDREIIEVKDAWKQTKIFLNQTLINKINANNKRLARYFPKVTEVFSVDSGKYAENAIKTLYTKKYDDFWRKSDIKKTPEISDASARQYHLVRELEHQYCYDTSLCVSNKYFKKKGLMPSKNSTKPKPTIKNPGTIAQARVDREITKKGGLKIDHTRDHRIEYRDLKELKKVVNTIIDALQEGYLIRCGVLSGIMDDTPPPPPPKKKDGTPPSPPLPKKKDDEKGNFPVPEHYILLFAHDKILNEQDTFVFWDPDAPSTYISDPLNWGQGFGVLFFNSDTFDTFSTAYDADDMNRVYKVDRPELNQSQGDHIDQPRRHRYQVYNVVILDK